MNTKNQKRLSEAIDRLAGLVDHGDLLAATDPAGLIDAVADELELLRNFANEDAARAALADGEAQS